MSTIKVAINGFGRIGRNLFKLLHHHENIEVVAINDLADAHTLSHLLKFDSIHGIFDADIRFRESVQNWHTVRPDIVIEATGKFKTTPELEHHIKNGAKKVILAVPPQDDQIKMVVLGVNDHNTIISNASCTTNNAAPMIKVIDELCGVEQAYITTVHSYTTDQSLHDQPHRDLRRARAAGQSIVPTTTGAAKALTKVFPHLANVIGGCGIRVPIANGSLTDITFNVKKDTSIEVINKALEEASQTHLKGIIEYTDLPIVSVDIIGNTHSCVFDSQMTSVIGKMVKIIGWYDNEIGYSSRIIDLILFINRK